MTIANIPAATGDSSSNGKVSGANLSERGTPETARVEQSGPSIIGLDPDDHRTTAQMYRDGILARLRAEGKLPAITEPPSRSDWTPGPLYQRPIRPTSSNRTQAPNHEADLVVPERTLPEPINWSEFWNKEIPNEEWLIQPILAKGRQTALYAKAKVGKSLLLLDACAAAVTGRSVFGQPPQPPIRVVYLDLEMTEADVRERLDDLGYGLDDDMSGLAYYMLPDLPPLDSAAGGAVVEEIATMHRADLVVIDTMSRAVEGNENDADTYRDFYRHTGRRIKAMGISLGRLDHAGKSAAAGQRGSSSKNDDVDVVFELTVGTDGQYATLKRTHTRVPWVPAEMNFRRESADRFQHILMDDGYPAGTQEVAELLTSLGVPVDTTIQNAVDVLKGAGNGRRRTLVSSAVKSRRSGRITPRERS